MAGRKSAAAAAITQLPGQRTPPPPNLTATEADIWRSVVLAKPASWFCDDTIPVLSQYCRHVATADLVAKLIHAIDPETLKGEAGLEHLERLLVLRDRESKIIVRLATSMRLTLQSRLKAETAHTQASKIGGAQKPWQAV